MALAINGSDCDWKISLVLRSRNSAISHSSASRLVDKVVFSTSGRRGRKAEVSTIGFSGKGADQLFLVPDQYMELCVDAVPGCTLLCPCPSGTQASSSQPEHPGLSNITLEEKACSQRVSFC